jgi:hypothetical protein
VNAPAASPSPPAWETVDAVEGWFTFESYCLWNALLPVQPESGDLVEVGVHKGRSARVLAGHRRAGEQVRLCDPALSGGVPAGLEDCEILAQRSSLLQLERSTVRWFHIDGEHSGRAVYGDLATADAALAEGGLIALDDFFSPQYPQITEAVYGYLRDHPYSLRLVLVGFLKAYLCRPSHYLFYQDFIVRGLPGAMAALGAPVSLCKTSGPEDCFTFGVYAYREDLGRRHGTNGRLPLVGLAEFR